MHYIATRDGIINENHMEIESDGENEELSEERSTSRKKKIRP
jgi:hypothetical protein